MADLSAFEQAVVKAGLGFAHSRLVSKTGEALKGAEEFVGSLIGVSSGTPKQRLNDLKPKIKTLAGQQANVTKLVAKLGEAATAIAAVASNLGAGGANGIIQAMDQLAIALAKADEAVELVATIAALGDKTSATYTDIAALPNRFVSFIATPASETGDVVAKAFDGFIELVLGWKHASAELAKALKWDKTKRELTSQIATVQVKGTPEKGFSFDGAKLEAFFLIPGQAKAGLRLSGTVQPGLRSDPMMKSIIPGEAETKAKTPLGLTLDSLDGLALGEGKNKRIVTPLRLSLPGFELRELAISQPENVDRIDLTAVVAAKLGGLLVLVAEGGGVSVLPAGAKPKHPNGLGFRIAAGPVTGGGFLNYKEDITQYGGVAQLAFGPIDLYAMALLKPEPILSFVTLIGARFSPKIELGFGFTLNGVGGLLAYNREVSIEALTAGIRSGVVSNLLFPSDPVANAPTIIGQLGSVFPEKQGGFAIGPMFELGWGSQAEIVRARIGIVIQPSNPQLVVLGAVSIQVPPDVPGATKKLPKIVDLNLDMLAVITASQFYLRAALHNSTIAGQPLQGDLGFYLRWAGSAGFAISAGGFYPGYPAPPELKDLNRLAIPIKAPFKVLKINATGYFALTSNSVQVGGQIDLVADLSPAKGEAYFGLDALFEWSPSLHFEFQVRAGIKLSFFGETVAGVSFNGKLSGTSPWRLSGYASVSVLFWDIDFDLGPYTWGEVADKTEAIHVLQSVADAFASPEAWSARSTKKGQYRLRAPDPGQVVLIDPGSIVTAHQSLLPFDTYFERVGAFPTIEHEINFAAPRFGTQPAKKVGHAKAQFAPGQFLDLKKDQQLSRPPFETLPAGVEMAAAEGAVTGEASERTLTWETHMISPQTKATGPSWTVIGQSAWLLNGIAGAISAELPLVRQRRNTDPYGGAGPRPKVIGVRPAGLKQVVPLDTRAATAASAPVPTSAAARMVELRGGPAAGVQMRAAGVMA